MLQQLPKPCCKSEHTGQSPDAFHHQWLSSQLKEEMQDFIKAQFLASLSYLGALLLEEFGVYFLADDLCANVILDSNTKPHLFQDKFHFLLFLHGAICLHLSRGKKYSKNIEETLHMFPIYKCGHKNYQHDYIYSGRLLRQSHSYLKLLKNGSCLFDLSTLLLDIGQGLRQPGALNLYIDL